MAKSRNRLSIYKNAGVYYELQQGNQYFHLIVSQEKPTVLSASASKSMPQEVDTKRAVEPRHVTNSDDSGGIGWLGYLAGALVLALMMLFYYRSQELVAVTKITGKEWVEKNVSGFFGIFSVAEHVKKRHKLMVGYFGQEVVEESIREHGFDRFVPHLFESELFDRIPLDWLMLRISIHKKLALWLNADGDYVKTNSKTNEYAMGI